MNKEAQDTLLKQYNVVSSKHYNLNIPSRIFQFCADTFRVFITELPFWDDTNARYRVDYCDTNGIILDYFYLYSREIPPQWACSNDNELTALTIAIHFLED